MSSCSIDHVESADELFCRSKTRFSCRSNVFLRVQNFIGKVESEDELEEFLAANDNADGLIVTSIETTNEKSHRQLAFYVKDAAKVSPLNTCLHQPELNLNLRERDVRFDGGRMKFFDQENVRASRKQILPFLEEHL